MLAQKLILSYGSKVSIQFLRIAASIVVARVAGPTVLGTVAFGLAFVSMFGFLADLGIGTAHIKMVSEGEDLGKCISTFSVLKLANILIFFLVVLGVFSTQKYILKIQFESSAHEYVILITLVALVVNQLLYIAKTTFAGKIEQAKQDVPEIIRAILHQFLRIVIVLLGYKAVALAFGNLISTILIVPLVLYLFKNYPRARFDKKLAMKYFKISVPVLMIGMVSNVINYLDKVMLQYFTNSEQVGYYTAGFRIGGLVLLIGSSAGLLFFPLFSKATARGDLMYIKDKIDKFERFSFLFVMPAVIFLSLFSDVIIRFLLGEKYLPSIPVMAIINLAMFLMMLNLPYGNVITGMGFFKLAAFLNLFDLFLFVILMFILPNPKLFNFSAVGAAMVVLISNIYIGIVYRIYAKRKCKVLDLKIGLKFFLFGLFNLISFYFLYNHFSKIYGSSFKILFIPIYFGLTYLILFLLGWINKRDFTSIKLILDIRKIGKYIKGEISEK